MRGACSVVRKGSKEDDFRIWGHVPMLEGEAMKRTKLQREAFKMARWWLNPDPYKALPFKEDSKIAKMDHAARYYLNDCGEYGFCLYASAILSEVM
jgi:hypothetical protein